MKRCSTVVSIFILSVLVALATGRGAAAQATVIDPSPNADECTLAPRTIEELQAIYGTPADEGAGEATAIAMQEAGASAELPQGVPAETAVVEAVTIAIRANMACYNAGNYLAGFSGVTDEFIRSQVGLALFDADFVALMTAAPEALPEHHQTTLLGVRNVLMLADGRVAVLVDYISPTPQPEGIGGVETDLWIMKDVNGSWQLDGSIQDLETLYGPPAIAGAARDTSPNPEECTMTPRSVDELQALYGEPAPAHSGEATAAALADEPAAEHLTGVAPADGATIAAIISAIRGNMACYNAGNYLAGFSGTTDEFIRSQVGLSLFDEDFVALLTAEPTPLNEEQQTVLLGVRNVRVLADGRVAALVDYTSPTPQAEGIDGIETDLWIFKHVDGRWLLDGSIQNLEADYGPPIVSAN